LDEKPVAEVDDQTLIHAARAENDLSLSKVDSFD